MSKSKDYHQKEDVDTFLPIFFLPHAQEKTVRKKLRKWLTTNGGTNERGSFAIKMVVPRGEGEDKERGPFHALLFLRPGFKRSLTSPCQKGGR